MEPTLAETLRAIDEKDDARLDSLAAAVRDQGERKVREAVSIMHGKDPVLARMAFGIILDAGPVAINPILDSLNPGKPAQAVLELQHAVDLAQQDRARLADTLTRLLDDKRNVPLPEQPANTEERLPPRRLCDEAYLLLRKLLSPEESADDQLRNGRLFLDLDEAQRDKEIAVLKRSKRFTPLQEYFPGEEGGARN
jgi:hypothetical protein